MERQDLGCFGDVSLAEKRGQVPSSPLSCCESWAFRAVALAPALVTRLSRGAQLSSVRSPPAVSPASGRTRKMLSPETRHVAGCGRSWGCPAGLGA